MTTTNATLNTTDEIRVTAEEAQQEFEEQRRKESDQLLQPETVLPLAISNLCKLIKDGLIHTAFCPEFVSICPSYQLETDEEGNEITGSRISDLMLSVTMTNINGFNDTFTCNLSLIGDDDQYSFDKNSKAAAHILKLFKSWVDVFALKLADGTKQEGPKLSEEIKKARAALIEEGRKLKSKKEKTTKQLLIEARKEQDAQNVQITNLYKQLDKVKANSVANVIEYAQNKKQTSAEELAELQAYKDRFISDNGVLMILDGDDIREANPIEQIDYQYLDEQINNCKDRITANEKLAAYMETVAAQKEQVEALEEEKLALMRKRGAESLTELQAIGDAVEWNKAQAENLSTDSSLSIQQPTDAANTEEQLDNAA